MVKQDVLDRQYLETAFGFAGLSHARRKKVGALLVIPEGGRFEGINGMPSGFDNHCEHVYSRHRQIEKVWINDQPSHFECPRCQETWSLDQQDLIVQANTQDLYISDCMVTREECLHAEANALAKVARSTQSTIGSTMYTSLSPCVQCAKLMIQCGVARVVCGEVYRKTDGIDLLRKYGIQVDIVPLQRNHVGDEELTLQDEGRHYDDEDKWRGYRP